MDDRRPTSSPPAGPALQPEDTVPAKAVSLQGPLAAREALKELRKLVRVLPEPARSEALANLSTVSRELPAKKRPRRAKSDEQFRKALHAFIVAYGKRVEESDWGPDLKAMVDDSAFFSEVVGNTVRSWNRSGRHSWPEIGRHLGVSHQATHQRWGPSTDI